MEVIIGNYTQTYEESLLEEECWPLSLSLFLLSSIVCLFLSILYKRQQQTCDDQASFVPRGMTGIFCENTQNALTMAARQITPEKMPNG